MRYRLTHPNGLIHLRTNSAKYWSVVIYKDKSKFIKYFEGKNANFLTEQGLEFIVGQLEWSIR